MPVKVRRNGHEDGGLLSALHLQLCPICGGGGSFKAYTVLELRSELASALPIHDTVFTLNFCSIHPSDEIERLVRGDVYYKAVPLGGGKHLLGDLGSIL